MGFRPKRAPFKLDFSGGEYAGLEVSVRPVPMAVMEDVSAAITSGNPSAFRHVAATFVYAIESWNVEDDDGNPVPPDMDGLMSQDPRFVIAVIQAWGAAMWASAPGAPQ